MIKPAVLDAMVAAGCTAEQIAAVVKADQAQSTNAERQARFRARRKALLVTDSNVTGVTVTLPTPALDKEIPPTPPKEIKPSPISVVGSARELFAEFWALFPNKVGKGDAFRKFVLALQRASFEEIMEGLRRYVAKVDDRPWCNPTTFLNQDRWTDQPATVQPRAASPPRSESFIDAQQALEREGFFTDGQDGIAGHNGHADGLPAEFGDGQAGTVVDLRPGAARRLGFGNH